MNNASYVVLSRQSGLSKELTSIANNVANADTTGFRRDKQFYSEYIRQIDGRQRSISQTDSAGRFIDPAPGALIQTGNQFDLAIEGDGYFAIETPRGVRLSRAGAFTPDLNGFLATPEGFLLLDSANAPVAIPPGSGDVTISPEGDVSAGGNLIAQIGVFAADNIGLVREGDNLLRAETDLSPVSAPRMRQGFLEDSNVNPVIELSRLIEVQRAYELNQKLLQDEDERITRTIQNARNS